jgi:hypothetical protein
MHMALGLTGFRGHLRSGDNACGGVLDGTQATARFSYHPDGRLEQVDYPNGTQIAYGYSPKNRIASISHRRGGTLWYEYSYTYDGNGNRMTQVEQNDGISEQTVYGYDPLNRLRMYQVSGHGAPQRHEYDYAGYNRAAERRYEDGALVAAKTYVYDETNWLVEVLGDGD